MRYLEELNSQRWCGGGEGEVVFNGDRLSAWEGEKVLEMDGGDGCTIMRMYLMSLNCTLQNS